MVRHWETREIVAIYDCPIEYAALRATIYTEGAVKPWEWFSNHDWGREDWLEYALLSKSIEDDPEVQSAQRKRYQEREKRIGGGK